MSGSIGSASGPLRYSLVVDDPALFTAGALRAALQNAGITVDGALKAGKTPANAEKLASFASPPLSQIVSEMNRESINIVAELLYEKHAPFVWRTLRSMGVSSADVEDASSRGARPTAAST